MTEKDNRNMYDCLPCPKCKSTFRYITSDLLQRCDDCDFVEELDDYQQRSYN